MPNSTPQPVTVAVIGSRSFHNYAQLARELDALHRTTPIAGLVSGGAVGADQLAERYAQERGLPIVVIRPDYARHGRKAAPLLRNKLIIQQATLVLAFWNGTSKGTAHALKQARLLGGVTTIIVVPEQPSQAV